MNEPYPGPVEKTWSFLTGAASYATGYIQDVGRHIQDGDYLNSATESVKSLSDKIVALGTPHPAPEPPKAPLAPKTATAVDAARDWICRHKLLTALLAGTAVWHTAAYVNRRYTRMQRHRRRRARKTADGARTDVVLIIGNARDALTRVLAYDLERRGFIVYVSCNTPEEQSVIALEGSGDIKPFNTFFAGGSDSVNQLEAVKEQFRKFSELLSKETVPFPGAQPHNFTLCGVLVVPDTYCPSVPIEISDLDSWIDVLYSRLLFPVAMCANGLVDLVRNHNSRIICVSPCIVASLQPPFHALESVATNAVETLFTTLERELAPQNIPVCQVHVGSLGGSAPAAQDRAASAEVLTWPADARTLYGREYHAVASLTASAPSASSAGRYGAGMKSLQRLVFDVLTNDARTLQRDYYIGQGAWCYAWVGRNVAKGFVAWMLSAGGHVEVRRQRRKRDDGIRVEPKEESSEEV